MWKSGAVGICRHRVSYAINCYIGSAAIFCTLGLKMGFFGVKMGETETFCSFIPLGMQYPGTNALLINNNHLTAVCPGQPG